MSSGAPASVRSSCLPAWRPLCTQLKRSVANQDDQKLCTELHDRLPFESLVGTLVATEKTILSHWSCSVATHRLAQNARPLAVTVLYIDGAADSRHLVCSTQVTWLICTAENQI